MSTTLTTKSLIDEKNQTLGGLDSLDEEMSFDPHIRGSHQFNVPKNIHPLASLDEETRRNSIDSLDNQDNIDQGQMLMSSTPTKSIIASLDEDGYESHYMPSTHTSTPSHKKTTSTVFKYDPETLTLAISEQEVSFDSEFNDPYSSVTSEELGWSEEEEEEDVAEPQVDNSLSSLDEESQYSGTGQQVQPKSSLFDLMTTQSSTTSNSGGDYSNFDTIRHDKVSRPEDSPQKDSSFFSSKSWKNVSLNSSTEALQTPNSGTTQDSDSDSNSTTRKQRVKTFGHTFSRKGSKIWQNLRLKRSGSMDTFEDQTKELDTSMKKSNSYSEIQSASSASSKNKTLSGSLSKGTPLLPKNSATSTVGSTGDVSPANSFSSLPASPSSASSLSSGTSGKSLETESEQLDSLSEPCLIITKNKRGKSMVKAGTLEKLVERLTFEKFPDPEFTLQFLLTYRSFTNPHQLFDLLVDRFDIKPPLTMKTSELDSWKLTKLKPVRLRVYNTLKTWIQEHPHDFQMDKQLVSRMRAFANTHLANHLPNTKQAINRYLDRSINQSSSDIKKQFDVAPPKPFLPKSFSSEDLNIHMIETIEIARQLTLIEYSLFADIHPKECLNQNWNKRPEESPSIRRMIAFFNHLSHLVATTIISEAALDHRTAVLGNWIQVANHCRDLNNFNAITAINAGLGNAAIYRLKKTWEELSLSTKKRNKKKLIQIRENLATLVSREGNFKNFRKALHSVSPPCIPYLGVYLTDLTFIEDGNPDTITNDDGIELINFRKCTQFSEVIREMQTYQVVPYNLTDIPFIQSFLKEFKTFDDKELYEKSLILEPRERSS